MKIVSKLLVLALIFVSFSSIHSTDGAELCRGFIPENSLNIPVFSAGKKATGISEATFGKIIDDVESFYKPIVAAKGGTLKTNRLWTNGTVNASASQSGHTWTLNMYGGLARYPGMTEDGFALVMCHELGHHLGEFPKVSSWAANEGQADYFSTMKCFRRVHESDAPFAGQVSSTVQSKCAVQHHSQKEISMCEREVQGGLDLAKVLNTLGGSTVAPSVDTPDLSQVSETYDEHPEAQCRLDTYFAGSICGISFQEDFGNNAVLGSCAEEKGDTFGFRPRCWYKPSL